MRAIILNPGEAPIFEDKDWSLDDLQAVVGGWIESLPTDRDDISVYGNDEAKYRGEDGGPMPRNQIATEWIGHMLFPGDYIAGPVIVLGFDPETGENAELPSDIENEFTIR